MRLKKCPKCGHSAPVEIWISFGKCPHCHYMELLEELRKEAETMNKWGKTLTKKEKVLSMRKCPWCGYVLEEEIHHYPDKVEFKYQCKNCRFTYVEVVWRK